MRDFNRFIYSCNKDYSLSQPDASDKKFCYVIVFTQEFVNKTNFKTTAVISIPVISIIGGL